LPNRDLQNNDLPNDDLRFTEVASKNFSYALSY
jgi:hypothetical protein